MRIYHEAKVSVPLDGIDSLLAAHEALSERGIPENATVAQIEVFEPGFGLSRLRVTMNWREDSKEEEQ